MLVENCKLTQTCWEEKEVCSVEKPLEAKAIVYIEASTGSYAFFFLIVGNICNPCKQCLTLDALLCMK